MVLKLIGAVVVAALLIWGALSATLNLLTLLNKKQEEKEQ